METENERGNGQVKQKGGERMGRGGDGMKRMVGKERKMHSVSVSVCCCCFVGGFLLISMTRQGITES